MLNQGRHRHIFERRKFRKEVVKLEDKSDASIPKRRQFLVIFCKEIRSTKMDGSLRWTVECTEEMQEGRFAGAAFTHNSHNLTRFYDEIQVVENDERVLSSRVVLFDQVVDNQKGRIHGQGSDSEKDSIND